ncbi:MAG: Flp family type IVb pilin [Hyphomonadaceae bacterium]
MMRLLKNTDFLKHTGGHTAIEYSMIAALVALLLVTAMGSMGESVLAMFTNLMPAFAGEA